MNKFNKFGRERSNSSRSRGFDDRGRGRPQMYEAICSDCGKKCEVPFKPTGDKPVYCSQCFENHGGKSSSDGPKRRDYGFKDKRGFEAICDKCGKRFELPFRPTGDKPVYCNSCFRSDGPLSNESGYKEQFEILNDKLDKIIKALVPAKDKETNKSMAKGNNSRKKETKKPKKDKKKK